MCNECMKDRLCDQCYSNLLSAVQGDKVAERHLLEEDAREAFAVWIEDLTMGELVEILEGDRKPDLSQHSRHAKVRK